MKMSKSIAEQVQDIYDKQLKVVIKNKSSIREAAAKYAKEAYTNFGRPPIDTGESQKNTNANLEINNAGLTLTTHVDTDYAKYFMDGLGSNAKYGKRNPLKQSVGKIVAFIVNILRR